MADLHVLGHHLPADCGVAAGGADLGAYVPEQALGVEGPIREYYVIGPHETADQNQWRTEIGWPIFHTGQAAR
jgi:hypothetical protein